MAGPRITAEIGVDGRGFASGMNKAAGTAQMTAKKIAGYFAGAFGAHAIASHIKRVFSDVGSIRDKAMGLGLTIEQFQEMDYAARQSGATIDDVGRAFKTLATAQVDAVRGSKEQQIAFAALGISADDLKNKNVRELFFAIAKGFEAGRLGVNDLGAAAKVMGKSVQTLIAPMQSGFEKMANEARLFGVVISNEVGEDIADMNDKLLVATKTLEAFTAQAIVASTSFGKESFQGLKAFGGSVLAGIEGFFSRTDSTALDTAIEKFKSTWEAFGEQFAEDDAEDIASIREKVAARVAAIKAGLGIEAIEESSAAKTKAEKSIKQTTTSIASDALARIGGFTGRGNVHQENVQMKIVRANERTAQAVEGLRRDLNKP